MGRALTGSMVQGQFINDKQVLLSAAEEAGVEGAQHLLDTEDELKSEVGTDLLPVHGSNLASEHQHMTLHFLTAWLS